MECVQIKDYWSISGPRKAPHEDCIAFNKLDGNNIRCEWSKKRGWYKFGSRTVLLDPAHPIFGCAVALFEAKYAEPLVRAVLDNKEWKVWGVEKTGLTVYCELYGPSSFAGWHVDGEELTVTLIDVNINKRGMVPPREFVKIFSKVVETPAVVYEGKFNKQFIEDVYQGKYPVKEGVVAKGILPGRKPQHGIWMAKAKTKWWLDELRRRAETDIRLRQELQDNLREQEK